MSIVPTCSSHLQLLTLVLVLPTAEPEVQGQRETSQSLPAPAPPGHRGHSHEHPGGSGTNIAWMVLLGDGLHNLTDGLALGLLSWEQRWGGGGSEPAGTGNR